MTATPEASELIDAESPSKQWRGFSRGSRKGRTPSGPNDLKAALLFILPASIGFVTFFAFPAIRGFYLSLTNLDFRSYEATRSGLTCWFGFCSGVA